MLNINNKNVDFPSLFGNVDFFLLLKQTKTPVISPAAFPVGKTQKVTPPKPVVIEEDEVVGEEDVATKSPPVFIMSGLEVPVWAQ